MTELLTMIFMLSTAIVMLLIYLRLRDMDHNASVHTHLIRQDIIEREGYISAAVSDCALQVSNTEKHLTTEIACLATKNNEDIKRLKGNYEIGDILRFDDIRWYIFGKDLLDDGRTRWKLFGENGAEYRIYTDAIPEGIEFLGHKDLSFE